MDDLAIIELYHRREEKAIAESDKKYGTMCRSIALRLLGLKQDAEECVNDTWFAAWNKMPPERPGSLGAFLGRITRNLSISRWRRDHAHKRYDGMEILLSELEDCVPSPNTVEKDMARHQLAQSISAWLDNLESEDRWLLHLDDGRYALVECKLGSQEIEEAAKHLHEIKRLIAEKNAAEKQNRLREPDLLLVLTGGEMAYTREDGVKVIPIGCLKD